MKIPTEGNLRKIGVEIDGDCSYCGSHLEKIDHLFRDFTFTTEVWSNFIVLCPSHVNISMHFLDLIEWLWKNDNVYNKLHHSPIEK